MTKAPLPSGGARRRITRSLLGLLGLVTLAASLALPGLHAQTRFMYLNGQSVHPAFEGWWPNDDGSFTLWFGYMNSNWEEEFDVPVGPDNYFAVTEPQALNDLELDAIVPAVIDKGQPTHLYPRRNPFLFTVRVPADFGEQELVWTLTTHGRKDRAYASLRPDYRMDTQVMSTEVGGAYGSLDDRLRENQPPDLDVEGDLGRRTRVGESVTLVAFAEDPDNFPPRREDRGGPPETLEELYSTRGVGSRHRRAARPQDDVDGLPRSRQARDLRPGADEGVDRHSRVGKLAMVAAIHIARTAFGQSVGG